MFDFVDIDLDNLELLMNVRNMCCEYMTRNNNILIMEQQRDWFSSQIKCLANLVYDKKKVCGFSNIIPSGDCVYITGGLVPEYRNLGYGKILFGEICKRANMYSNKILLEVLQTNVRAYKTYKSLGFVEYGLSAGVVKMEKLCE